MAAGIRIINDYGTTLIDDQSMVLTLRSINDQTGNGGTTYDYIVTNCTYPQFFYSDCPNGIIVRMYSWSNADNGYTGQPNGWFRKAISVGVNDDGSSAGRTTSFKGWVMDEPLNNTPSTHGMKIFNSSGELVFDALQKNTRVVGTIEGYGSMVVPAGRVYAIGLLSEQFRQDSIQTPAGSNNYGNRVLRTAVFASATSVGIQEAVVDSYITIPNPSGTHPTLTYGSPRALVVDVTGY